MLRVFYQSKRVCSASKQYFARKWKSSVASAFDCKSLTNGSHDYNVIENTKHNVKPTGLFGDEALSQSSGFVFLQNQAEQRVKTLRNNAKDCDDPVKVVGIFDNLSNEICKVADLAEFVHLTHPDSNYRDAASQAGLSLSALVEQLNVDKALYNVLKSANDVLARDQTLGNEVTTRVAELLLFDFEQSGIHLKGDIKEKALNLHNNIRILETLFLRGVSDVAEVPVSQWPQDVIHNFPIVDQQLQITSVRYNADDPILRQLSYKAFMHPNQEQERTFDSLLSARNMLAKTLGFNSYSYRCLKGTMVSNPDNAFSFLVDLFHSLRPKAMKELSVLQAYKSRDIPNDNGIIMPYDMQHYMGNAIYDNYKLSNSVSEYFSLGTCMDALSMIFSKIFGISLSYCDHKIGEVWSPDVRKIGVVHESEGLLGYIYCDLFARPGKIQSESHFTVRGGKVLEDNSYQLPVVCLVCNFPNPNQNMPTLLSPGMVDNLFHEMGHAMHSMLARTQYQHIAGTRCATDFAEVPSIFMEHFLSDANVLQMISKHYKTGEQLPRDVASNVIKAKKAFSALDSINQVYYAIVDQMLHSSASDQRISTSEVVRQAQSKYSILPHVEGTAWHLRFSHFAGYGAKYYSYMWSTAVASLVWRQFFAQDPLNRQAGELYRRSLLAHGGGKPPKEMIEQMLQKELTNNLLIKAYLDDIS